MTQTSPLILAADIGGTNTRVALLDGTNLRESSISRYENAKSDSLEQILGDFLSKHPEKPDAVSLALAGPVSKDHGKLTNLDWSITTKGASDCAGGAMATLLNDLQAQGHALPYLSNEAFKPIQDAPKQAVDASKACALGQAAAAVTGGAAPGASLAQVEQARDQLRAMLKG